MASKWNPTHVANGEEYSRGQFGKEISKSTLAQRARREREQTLKQSTAVSGKENSQTQPLHEINVGVALDEHCANIVNNVRNREKIHIEPLRERNVGVAIHGERNVNVMRIREVPNGSIISKKSMAQRARRERERNLNQGHSYPSGQRSQLGRTNECLQPIPQAASPSLTPICRPLNCFRQGSIETQSKEKRQRVAQISTSLPFMPNTSSTKHTNWPNITDQVELCCEEELEVPINFEGPRRTHIIPGRHNLGNMDIQCHHCKALHWMDERLAKSSISNPLFGT